MVGHRKKTPGTPKPKKGVWRPEWRKPSPKDFWKRRQSELARLKEWQDKESGEHYVERLARRRLAYKERNKRPEMNESDGAASSGTHQ